MKRLSRAACAPFLHGAGGSVPAAVAAAFDDDRHGRMRLVVREGKVADRPVGAPFGAHRDKDGARPNVANALAEASTPPQRRIREQGDRPAAPRRASALPRNCPEPPHGDENPTDCAISVGVSCR